MKKLTHLFIFVFLPGMILLFFSCTPQTCYDNIDADVKASLYSYDTKKKQAPDSISLWGPGMESDKLYDEIRNVTIVNFPLNVTSDSCALVISINGVNDTVSFVYDSFVHLISKECGYTYFHNMSDNSPLYTNHVIDSVSVIKRSITNLNEENIRIFY
jgi:hypothetical protein